jgi:hypothetical protein
MDCRHPCGGWHPNSRYLALIALRPAAVIRIRTTPTDLPPAIATSRFAANKLALNEPGQHTAFETMVVDEQRGVDARTAACKQRERAALLGAEAAFLRGRGHRGLSLSRLSPPLTAANHPPLAAGNASHPVTASPQLGCCNVAPWRPHSEQRAFRRKMSDDASVPQRMTKGTSATAVR